MHVEAEQQPVGRSNLLIHGSGSSRAKSTRRTSASGSSALPASSSSTVPSAALAEPTIIMQASKLKDQVNEVDAEKKLLLTQVARTKCDVVEGHSVLPEPSSEKLLVGDADALEKKVSVWEKKGELVPKKDEALEKFGRLAFGAQGGDQEAAGVDQLDAVGDEFG